MLIEIFRQKKLPEIQGEMKTWNLTRIPCILPDYTKQLLSIYQILDIKRFINQSLIFMTILHYFSFNLSLFKSNPIKLFIYVLSFFMVGIRPYENVILFVEN